MSEAHRIDHAEARAQRHRASPAPRADETFVPDLASVALRPIFNATQVLGLQRSIGNAATVASLLRIQRQPNASVAVTGVKLSATKVSVPPESGLNLRASAVPSKATGVQWSVQNGSVSPTGVTIDANTGVITLASGQAGGTVTIKATSDDGSWATFDLRIVEKPTAVASTTASSQGGSVYGGQFTHTFSDASGTPSGLDGENINERFDALSVKSPFGQFTLAANAAGSHGWDLNSSGTMAGPDNVTIDKSGVNVGNFVTSASNPSPAQTLPVGFTMTQHMRAKSFPSGNMDAAAFADIDHVRTLTANETFKVTAGKQSVEDAYTGASAYTNANASPATVNASAAKPAAPNTVQVTADVIPSSGPKVFSIVGPALGCKIDKATGLVTIGTTAGTIKVRVSAGKGANFDEVTITINAPPPPQPANP